MKAFMIPPRIVVAFDGCGTVAVVRLVNVQETAGCHVDCGTGFLRWINKNVDYVKVIKKMDYKLFVLRAK